MQIASVVYQGLLWFILMIAAVVTVVLFVITAPYGRFMRKGFGPSLPSVAGWVIMESVASLGMFLWFWVSPRTHDPVSIVFLALWQTHYLYRAFIFPVTRKGKHKPMPVSIMLSAVLFNGINGYLNGRWLFTLGPERCLEWFWDSRFIVGCGLFFAGLIINRHSDRILLGLRKSGEENYSIPYGGLFRFVSMPNYLGEIIQWVGWALATWSLGGLSFALFTAANLVPRAYKIHQWYQSHFPDYPKDRRAIVPFVF